MTQNSKRLCRITNKEFEVTNAEREFIAHVGTLHPSVREPLPLPTVHPLENIRQIASYGNFFYLYRSKSSFSGKPQISRFNPQLEFKICTLEEFWGETIDNVSFGRPYDFTRPFFEQYYDLAKSVYLAPIVMDNCENCDFINGGNNCINCYLCFYIIDSEDCLYCVNTFSCVSCMDCVGAKGSQFCYACCDIEDCNECAHCQDCERCSNSFGCLDCIGCNDCFGCVGLKHAQYCVFNEQITRDSYLEFVSTQKLSQRISRAEAHKKCLNFIKAQNHEVDHNRMNEDSFGDYLRNCKNAHECYISNELEDCGHLFISSGSKSSWRGLALKSELTYQTVSTNCQSTLYGYNFRDTFESLYCFQTFNQCQALFGCVGLNRKSHCILNKQYTPVEYFELVPRIIRHMKSTREWGEFFPVRHSPHAYEECLASEYLQTIPAEEAARRGYRMEKIQESTPSSKARNASEIPEKITENELDELKGVEWICSETGSPFNFQVPELRFYLSHQIPLPEQHWRYRLRHLLRQKGLVPAI